MNPSAVTFDTGDVETASTITGYTLPANFGVAPALVIPVRPSSG